MNLKVFSVHLRQALFSNQSFLRSSITLEEKSDGSVEFTSIPDFWSSIYSAICPTLLATIARPDFINSMSFPGHLALFSGVSSNG